MVDVALYFVVGAGTVMKRASFASAQDFITRRRASIMLLEIRRPHSTDGIRARLGQFWRLRSRGVVSTHATARLQAAHLPS